MSQITDISLLVKQYVSLKSNEKRIQQFVFYLFTLKQIPYILFEFTHNITINYTRTDKGSIVSS